MTHAELRKRSAAAAVGQRRELTFKANQGLGRHGLLRLTPAYSRLMVEAVLDRAPPAVGVLDPFCGTGTTPLVCAARGYSAQAIDVNPFLVWFAGVKTRRITGPALAGLRLQAAEFLTQLKRARALSPVPELHQIERWWSPPALAALQKIRAAIDQAAPKLGSKRRGGAALSKPGQPVALTTRAQQLLRDTLELALCRTLILVSNAAFNHPSMSFRGARGESAPPGNGPAAQSLECFAEQLELVLSALGDSPPTSASIQLGDARSLGPVAKGSFDRVVTSPPYANRMSYVRELRPYMYWTGHLHAAREAGELDWRAIGGTWGVATSRLGEWEPSAVFQAPSMRRAARAVRRSGAANAELLARYIERYFEDAFAHLSAVVARIARPGSLHYIVGNSSFYEQQVPTHKIYAEMFAELGCTGVQIDTLRKRNSKRELFEYEVSARL